jgi:hypothetical protein
MPWYIVAILICIVAVYLIVVEIVKRMFYRRVQF